MPLQVFGSSFFFRRLSTFDQVPWWLAVFGWRHAEQLLERIEGGTVINGGVGLCFSSVYIVIVVASLLAAVDAA